MTMIPHPKIVLNADNYQESEVSYPKRRSVSKIHCIRTVSKIIHKYLKLKKMFKPKVHLLLPKHIAERKTNCRTLYEKHLAAEK